MDTTNISNSDNLSSKRLYKLFILILKFVPLLSAVCIFFNIVICHFEIDIDDEAFSSLAGMGLGCWVFLFVATYVFHLPSYHRTLLYYFLVINIINIIDYEYTLPMSTWEFLAMEYIISGLSFFIAIYQFIMHRRKGNAPTE